MSIASEITRLQNAKDDLRTAIQAKGVTVPATAKLDDYDTYVASISTTPTLQAKTATPSTSQQVITPDYNYQGLSQVTVSAVTSAIDADIVAGNIKSGVNILGVTGTYTGDGSGGGDATVATATTTVGSSNASSISFTVSGQPKMFAVQVVKNSGSYLTNSSTTRYITSVISDWTTVYSTSVMYNSSSSSSRQAREYVYTTCSKSYSTSGNTKTLTITTGSTSTSGYFVASTEYRLIYIY